MSDFLQDGDGTEHVAISDGKSVTLGNTTDAAVTGDNAGTMSAKLRGLSKMLFDVWNSSMHFLQVGGVSAAGSPPGANPVSVAGWDGTNKQHLLTDGSGRPVMTGAAAAGAALAGNPVRVGVSDGANAQDWANAVRASAAGDGVGSAAMTLMMKSPSSGSAYTVLQNARGIGDNISVDSHLPIVSWVYNGLTFDRFRDNIDVTLLSSAARTTTQTSANITTYNAAGITVWMNTTAFGTSSNTLSVVEVDPASGAVVTLLASAAITGNGMTVLRIFPAITPAPNAAASLRIPRVIQILVTVGNANPSTYSCGYDLPV